MIRISSIGLSFINFVGNPRQPAAGSVSTGTDGAAVERRPSQEVSSFKVGSQASTYNEG